MSQRIRRRQCGCVNDCFGTDIKPRSEEIAATIPQQRACCEQCEDNEAPCVYVVLSACDFRIRYPGFNEGLSYVVQPAQLELRKVCITGCEYRTAIPQLPRFELVGTPPNRWEAAGDAILDPVFPDLCTIAERYWYPPEFGGFTAEDWQNALDVGTAFILRPIPDSGGYWEFLYVYPDAEPVTINYSLGGLSGSKVVTPPSQVGRTYRYVSVSPWKCFEANNLEINEESAAKYPGLPKYLCVRPRAESVAHLCDTTDSQCACCDNGMCTGYAWFELDCPGGLYEFPPFETKRYLPEDRLDAVGGDSPSSQFSECRTGQPPVPEEIEPLVPDVDTVPCGIFYGTFAGGGVVWWCDGTEYNMILWCIDPITEEAIVFYNGAPSEFTCRCDWYLFKVYFETPPACLQCPGEDPPIETECCEEATPASLDVEVVAFTGGGDFQPGCEACLGAGNYPAPLSGTTININYDSGTEIWDGSVSVCGVTLRATLECNNPGFANPFLLRLYVNGVEINNAALGTGGTFTCSPFYGETSSMAFSSMSDCVSLIATVSEAS